MTLLPGNLITENNQSVETSLGDWGSYGDRSSAIVQSMDQAHDGTFSVKCTHNSTIADGAMCAVTSTSDQPVVTAGVNYTFTFWVYSSVTASFYGLVDWYQSNGTTYIDTTTGVSITAQANTWTKVGLGGTQLAPALSARSRIYLNNLSGMANGDIAYFDEMFFGIPGRYAWDTVINQQAVRRTSLW